MKWERFYVSNLNFLGVTLDSHSWSGRVEEISVLDLNPIISYFEVQHHISVP